MEETQATQRSQVVEKREWPQLRSVCSFQSRLGPPEYRRWRRFHGLQLPLHPMQVAGWFVFFGVGMAVFLVLVPAMAGVARQSLYVALSTLFLLHAVSHLAAVLIDPADPSLRATKIQAVPEFDRTLHAHVIENGRCHLCNIATKTPQTKHCSVCNKCVHHFDHHCKWLNNCVGKRNYIAFIVCVVSAVLASLMVVALAVTELAYYHLNPTLLEVSSSDVVFLVVVGALGVISLITAALLLHLCLFHCYISILGITTYEYIRNYRAGKTNKCPDVRKFCCRWKNTREVGRTLKRQDTDPEFIDRVVKPFVVPIPEDDKSPRAPLSITVRELLKMCPNQLSLDISRRGSLTNKVKNNQVRPTTDEELAKDLERITRNSAHEPILLPLLHPLPSKLSSNVHLEELTSALDLAEYPLRQVRRSLKPRPHTPSLSPIRESGLSNPNSPRLPTVTPPMPRPTTPQVSTIFLSKPSSPCSSDEEEGEEAGSPVTFRPARAPEDVLQTPQMSRKIYSPKQMFVMRSSKLAVGNWAEG